MIGNIIGFIGLGLAVLAVIGLFRGFTPLLKLKGRLPAVGVLLGGLALIAVAGSMLPKSDVTLSWTPPNATVKLGGETYTQSPVKVKLTDLPYTVQASAAGYHSQSVRWDTEKQKSLHIDLKKITAEEIAAQKAAEEKKAQERAAAQAAASAKAVQQAKELDDGTFVVKCKDLVRQQLKAPSTAKFPSTMESLGRITNWENGNKDWSGWVDSQNSFGAMLRTEFLCEYDLDSQKIELTVKN